MSKGVNQVKLTLSDAVHMIPLIADKHAFNLQ